jgi:hypothetical protein
MNEQAINTDLAAAHPQGTKMRWLSSEYRLSEFHADSKVDGTLILSELAFTRQIITLLKLKITVRNGQIW